jgi:Raf kinase inhibitor-like YbhB/YbcL family protein
MTPVNDCSLNASARRAVRNARNFAACASLVSLLVLIRMSLMHKALLVIALATISLATSLHAQQGKLTDVEVVGHVYEPARLPPTDARAASLQVPSGFEVQRFAEGLDNPRILALGPDGSIYITQRKPGNVVLVRDLDHDGIADVQRIVLRLPQAHGIAIRGNQIFLTDVKQIYSGQIRTDGSIDNMRVISRGLPDGGQHPNRTLGFSPDGDLFVTVGSTCNECREPNPENATILKVNVSTGERETYATGLRNTIGFGWHPTAGRLYGFDHGIDWLGDNEQSEELNELRPKVRYGWPYVYDEDQFNPHNEPQELTLEQWAQLSKEPVGLYTPHSAPMQLAFYTGSAFPIDYRNDAFISMRGSWNRKPPSGYEIVRVRFDARGVFSAFEPFVTGFLEQQADGSFGYFARPVGSVVDASGAVVISDDTNNTLYRVVYGSATGTPAPQQLAADIFAQAPASLSLKSTAFAAGSAIPKRYSAYAENRSPPLQWAGAPRGVRSFVLLLEDPDAIAPLPFVHWTAINIPADSKALPEDVRKAFQSRGSSLLQGSTSNTMVGYFGPRPPPGDPVHHYHFQLFALDTTLNLPPGFNRQALLKAMQDHVLAKGTVIATYQQPNTVQ